MSGLGSQLSGEAASFDFDRLLGAPIKAMIDAQVRSSEFTARFIDREMLQADGMLKTQDFNFPVYSKRGRRRIVKLKIPLIAIAPIPCFLVQSMTISFNAQMTAMTKVYEQSETSVGVDISIGAGKESGGDEDRVKETQGNNTQGNQKPKKGGGGSVALSVKFSSNQVKESTISQSRSYEFGINMTVTIKPVPDGINYLQTTLLEELQQQMSQPPEEEEGQQK
mmetsp:Transcript_30565/g.76700  ORF Transcript_30565/g.76700 Transcript_30565/m.76700 type:complete len:223 (-) Transcript_30565:337-1005(-)